MALSYFELDIRVPLSRRKVRIELEKSKTFVESLENILHIVTQQVVSS
jgi:hypothetical protein